MITDLSAMTSVLSDDFFLISPIAVTMGEPAGIGGDILTTLYAQIYNQSIVNLKDKFPIFYCLDDPDRLTRIAKHLQLNCPIEVITNPDDSLDAWQSGLPVMPLSHKVDWTPGKADPAHAHAVIEAIDIAAAHVKSEKACAMVTNPIHKHNLYQSGFSFPGHTEYLAHIAGGCQAVMMIVVQELRVVPVTIHVSLAQVPAILTPDLLESHIRIVADALQRYWAIDNPRIAITGLNPHAGESGSMGTEEITWMHDKIQTLQTDLDLEHTKLMGPLPADTLFHVEARTTYDVVLGMYHDQVLTPVKMLDFDHGVNITLGLPFIRTSPDHGTAFNIAGSGKAKISSTACAILQAAQMASRQLLSLSKEI